MLARRNRSILNYRQEKGKGTINVSEQRKPQIPDANVMTTKKNVESRRSSSILKPVAIGGGTPRSRPMTRVNLQARSESRTPATRERPQQQPQPKSKTRAVTPSPSIRQRSSSRNIFTPKVMPPPKETSRARSTSRTIIPPVKTATPRPMTKSRPAQGLTKLPTPTSNLPKPIKSNAAVSKNVLVFNRPTTAKSFPKPEIEIPKEEEIDEPTEAPVWGDSFSTVELVRLAGNKMIYNKMYNNIFIIYNFVFIYGF